MMLPDLDPRMTFDSFVVGPGNRLASAAARRAADSPAASYNPLFLYSASGLGKSHILNAMAHHSERLNPDGRVLYQTLEGYLDELAEAIQSGQQEELKERYRDLDILLLDDVQFLTGQAEAQELLLRTLDSLNLSGSQIVLASDRPPAEIDGLDARLLSRFSGGLMVDIAPPEFETRVAIVRKKVEGRGSAVGADVVEAIARLPFRNVRELMGGLNRVLATQDLEGSAITADDVMRIVDLPAERPRLGRRADRIAQALVPDMMFSPSSEEPWQRQLREAAEEAEAEGFATARLRRILDGDSAPGDPSEVVADFQKILEELRQIRSDLDVVGNPWPEAARGVLKDPDRLEEARALLASAQERVREFPPFKDDVDIDALPDQYPALAVKAARQLLADEAPEYNPLFVWSKDGHGARGLLEAAATSCTELRPSMRVAMISAKEFADEFITALSEGVAGAWRERWWTVEFLLVYGCEELAHTERAQDEFFHLFEAVTRRGARVILAADRSPVKIPEIDDRLRSRFEGGLVVEIKRVGSPPPPREELLERRRERSPDATLVTSLDTLDAGGEVRGDLSVASAKEDAGSADREVDAEFQASLNALEGGSEQHGLTTATEGPAEPAPGALTSLTLEPDDFPTLLTELEKGRMAAGVHSWDASFGASAPPEAAPTDSAPEPTVADVPAASTRPEPSPTASDAPTDRSQADTADTAAAAGAPIVTAADLDVGAGAGGAAGPPTIGDDAGRAPIASTTDSTPESTTDPASEPTTDPASEPTTEPATTSTAGSTAEDDVLLPTQELDRAIDAVFSPYGSATPSSDAGLGTRTRTRARPAPAAPQTTTDPDRERDAARPDAAETPTAAPAASAPAPVAEADGPPWNPSPESVVWHWPHIDSRIVRDD